jgi:hypothetical protein
VFHLGRLLPHTILKRLARSKHSSLFRKFVTYGHKKFYNIGASGGDDELKRSKTFGISMTLESPKIVFPILFLDDFFYF